ncbi:MFS transporter [Streptomyces flavofungini]|uniref:MFS transporter n=1 Tax=Streptomyces flavofungini TaxID=68200 RepID=A0ABS0X0R9_9ACTN|nr:MFS transporter [Streptomyces flavofungini]MBJ3806773.1 MFS transporter [Streptomyces flavofungini]GHC60609.1 MFS transporter [Streptomyces flavofungini]
MSYREIASRGTLAWAAVAVGARMPVAMAPLAVVFLVREREGGYALGAILAAVYVVGEIVGAALLGMRMRAERARPQLAVGLGVGAVGFAALGALPDAPALVLAVCAFVAGGAPGAAPGGMRALLNSLVPERSMAQAMSAESVLVFVIWAIAPAAVTGLALGVAPGLPLLLAAALMGLSVPGLWLLPAGWKADESDRDGEPMLRIMARAWPVYVTGAAGLSLLALAELVLPALLEQREISVGMSGPLLAGLAVGSAVGSFVYGLRKWPGRLRTQSLVCMLAVSGCLAVVAVLPTAAWLAVGLACAGFLQAGSMLTRNLTLREVLPPSALAAGYSVMYAAIGAGYAVSGSLAGGLLSVTTPSTAILAGVGLTVVLTLVGTLAEVRPAPGAGAGAVGGGESGVVSGGGAAVSPGGVPERPSS